MAKSRKTGIRRSIERLLFPELIARGFEHSPGTGDSHLEPFGRFLRRTQGVEIIVIRFNKNRTSHFHFHVARAISEKTVWGSEVVPLEAQWPFQVDPNYLVWRRGLVFRHWFGVRKKAREGISEQEYDDAVRVAIGQLPLIDRYFERGKTTLAMAKFPQGPTGDLPYVGLCAAVVLGIFFGGLWVVGWMVRQL